MAVINSRPVSKRPPSVPQPPLSFVLRLRDSALDEKTSGPSPQRLQQGGDRVTVGESTRVLGSKVVDLGAARGRLRPKDPGRQAGVPREPLRDPIDGRQALVLTLVEQLSALVRGTISAERAGAVRRATSKALDLMEEVDAGTADASEAQRAFRDVEVLLSRPR